MPCPERTGGGLDAVIGGSARNEVTLWTCCLDVKGGAASSSGRIFLSLAHPWPSVRDVSKYPGEPQQEHRVLYTTT